MVNQDKLEEKLKEKLDELHEIQSRCPVSEDEMSRMNFLHGQISALKWVKNGFHQYL